LQREHGHRQRRQANEIDADAGVVHEGRPLVRRSTERGEDLDRHRLIREQVAEVEGPRDHVEVLEPVD